MTSRRDFLVLAGGAAVAASLPLQSVLADAPPPALGPLPATASRADRIAHLVSQALDRAAAEHDFFGPRWIAGADWHKCGDRVSWVMQEDTVNAAKSQGLDLEAELAAALAQETLAEADMKFFQAIREANPPGLTYRQDEWPAETFVGDQHIGLAILVLQTARRHGSANMCVVSPTALTILQAAIPTPNDPTFTRAPVDYDKAWVSSRQVGWISDPDGNTRLAVYVDQYAQDSMPVIVGHIPENRRQRSVAFVRGEVGFTPGFERDFRTVGVDTSTMRFL